jgi:hypothetical protein
MSEEAEFELICDGEIVASVSGPRGQALAEIRHYLLQYASDGDCEVCEVTRTPIDITALNTLPTQE